MNWTRGSATSLARPASRQFLSRLGFPQTMHADSTESRCRLSSGEGRWLGTRLSFTPAPPAISLLRHRRQSSGFRLRVAQGSEVCRSCRPLRFPAFRRRNTRGFRPTGARTGRIAGRPDSRSNHRDRGPLSRLPKTRCCWQAAMHAELSRPTHRELCNTPGPLIRRFRPAARRALRPEIACPRSSRAHRVLANVTLNWTRPLRDLSLRLSLSCYFVIVHFLFASPPFSRQKSPLLVS